MKIKLFFAWYDIWIGVYVDRKNKTVYICPLPCVVLSIKFVKRELYCPLYRKGLMCAYYQGVACGSIECREIAKRMQKQQAKE